MITFTGFQIGGHALWPAYGPLLALESEFYNFTVSPRHVGAYRAYTRARRRMPDALPFAQTDIVSRWLPTVGQRAWKQNVSSLPRRSPSWSWTL